MGRLLFSLGLALPTLMCGCRNGPPSAPNSTAPNGVALGKKTKQDLAIESILKRGGLVLVEFDGLEKSVVVADLHGFHKAAAALESLAPLTKLREVNLHATAFNDADLVLLRGLPNLQNVNLSGTKITDAGLAVLQTLPSLHILNLNQTNVTDAGLQYLRGMPNLTELSLYGT